MGTINRCELALDTQLLGDGPRPDSGCFCRLQAWKVLGFFVGLFWTWAKIDCGIMRAARGQRCVFQLRHDYRSLAVGSTFAACRIRAGHRCCLAEGAKGYRRVAGAKVDLATKATQVGWAMVAAPRFAPKPILWLFFNGPV